MTLQEEKKKNTEKGELCWMGKSEEGREKILVQRVLK